MNPNQDADVNTVDKDGKLYLAAANGHTATAQVLINAGADVEAVNVFGLTPLQVAAIKGHTETAQALIDAGANVEVVDFVGRTPLHLAAITGYTATAQALIDAGANVEAVSEYGNTPLYFAAVNGHTETAQALIDAGANVEVVNRHGYNPLHLAAMIGHTEIAQALIGAGANVNAVNHQGEPPIQVALQNGQQAMVILLQQHGAVLPAHLQQEANQINENQSVHEISVHKTVSESARKLSLRYQGQDFNASRISFLKWLDEEVNAEYDLKAQAAKRCLPRLLGIEFTDIRSNITMHNAIALIWLAANDSKIFSNEDIANNKVALIDALYEIQRGNNLNETGVDTGGDDKPICISGSFNKLIASLNCIHPDVNIRFVTKKTISAKAQSIMEDFYGSLSNVTKVDVELMWTNDGLDVPTRNQLKQFLEHHLHAEFDEFREEVLDYDEHLGAILDNLEYAAPPTAAVIDAVQYQRAIMNILSFYQKKMAQEQADRQMDTTPPKDSRKRKRTEAQMLEPWYYWQKDNEEAPSKKRRKNR